LSKPRAGFPGTRLRRLRRSPLLRALARETTLSPANFVQPFFVRPGRGVRRAIASMPGQFQLSVDNLVKDARETFRLGIPAVILFGIPSKKDPLGSEAWDPGGIVQRAARALKDALPKLVVITDLCLCEYTDHGHCGVVKNGAVDNDRTLALLQQTAVAQAEAGADIVAPSGMMDGAVGAIRQALEASGHPMTPILAYAVKFASAFYGPFRDAAQSPPRFGDRKSYQMDPANAREALREAALDVAEGADILMVKPALAYLDIVRKVKDAFELPTAVYNVSGEYAMVKAAAARGWMDEKATLNEMFLSLRRAGADIILSYHAREFVKSLGR